MKKNLFLKGIYLLISNLEFFPLQYFLFLFSFYQLLYFSYSTALLNFS